MIHVHSKYHFTAGLTISVQLVNNTSLTSDGHTTRLKRCSLHDARRACSDRLKERSKIIDGSVLLLSQSLTRSTPNKLSFGRACDENLLSLLGRLCSRCSTLCGRDSLALPLVLQKIQFYIPNKQQLIIFGSPPYLDTTNAKGD